MQQQQRAQKIVQDCYNKQQNALKISFVYQNLSASELRKIFQLIDCQTLRKITLNNMQNMEELIDTLLEFEFSVLEKISFVRCEIGQEGVRKLFGKDWPALQSVELHDNKIKDLGLQVLLNRAPKKLVLLNLSNNGIRLAGSKCLLTVEIYLQNLKILRLDSNYLGRRGIQLLIRSYLLRLEQLDLNDCSLTNDNIKHLVKGYWPVLEQLHLRYNKGVSPKCLNHLGRAKWNLIKLGTNFNNVLSIHYFSAVVIPSTSQQFKIVGQFIKERFNAQLKKFRQKQVLERAKVKI